MYPVSAHIPVMCVIQHSVKIVVLQDFKEYIVVSISIPVSYVIMPSLKTVVLQEINAYIVVGVRISKALMFQV
jgi:hypothetical protein